MRLCWYAVPVRLLAYDVAVGRRSIPAFAAICTLRRPVRGLPGAAIPFPEASTTIARAVVIVRGSAVGVFAAGTVSVIRAALVQAITLRHFRAIAGSLITASTDSGAGRAVVVTVVPITIPITIPTTVVPITIPATVATATVAPITIPITRTWRGRRGICRWGLFSSFKTGAFSVRPLALRITREVPPQIRFTQRQVGKLSPRSM